MSVECKCSQDFADTLESFLSVLHQTGGVCLRGVCPEAFVRGGGTCPRGGVCPTFTIQVVDDMTSSASQYSVKRNSAGGHKNGNMFFLFINICKQLNKLVIHCGQLRSINQIASLQLYQ